MTRPPQPWDEQIGINLRGAYLTIQAAVPHLHRPAGRIIISSIAAYTGGSRPVPPPTPRRKPGYPD